MSLDDQEEYHDDDDDEIPLMDLSALELHLDDIIEKVHDVVHRRADKAALLALHSLHISPPLPLHTFFQTQSTQ